MQLSSQSICLITDLRAAHEDFNTYRSLVEPEEEVYECDNCYTFTGNYEAVAAHEAACTAPPDQLRKHYCAHKARRLATQQQILLSDSLPLSNLSEPHTSIEDLVTGMGNLVSGVAGTLSTAIEQVSEATDYYTKAASAAVATEYYERPVRTGSTTARRAAASLHPVIEESRASAAQLRMDGQLDAAEKMEEMVLKLTHVYQEYHQSTHVTEETGQSIQAAGGAGAEEADLLNSAVSVVSEVVQDWDPVATAGLLQQDGQAILAVFGVTEVPEVHELQKELVAGLEQALDDTASTAVQLQQDGQEMLDALGLGEILANLAEYFEPADQLDAGESYSSGLVYTSSSGRCVEMVAVTVAVTVPAVSWLTVAICACVLLLSLSLLFPYLL